MAAMKSSLSLVQPKGQRTGGSIASGMTVEEEAGLHDEEPEIFIPDLERDELTGRCLYFIRECNRDVGTETVDQDLSSGELCAPLFETMDLLLSELHAPYLQDGYDWGRIHVDGKEQFLMMLGSLREHIQEAVSGIHGGTQLCSLSPEILNDPRAGAWNKMANDSEVVTAVERVLEEWLRQVDALLRENDLDVGSENDDSGPATELSWWRKRMTKLANVVEQLKGREAKAVLGLANAAKSKLLRRWKATDGQLTDLLNEAKDNVKYLSSLDHFIEPLYTGTIAQIKDSLPGLFTNLKMMVSIARYYSTGERITRLLRKIANQIIAGCRRCITRKGPVTEQVPAELVENTRVCIGICQDFQEHCNQLKEKLLAISKGQTKPVDFEPAKVFPNIEKFVKRMQNVVEMINTSMQFSTLYEAQVEGMQDIISRFERIKEDIRLKPYDFFDYKQETFDVDFVVIGKQIVELEQSLKAFIDVSFEDMQSTENALSLLGMLEAILERESLKQDLADKYALIFDHYGEELDEVQEQYDREKLSPPMPRNSPPVAGNIMWARQLLTRVEEPMQRFLSNKAILSGRESRHIVRKYNKVALTLTEFETLWYQAWCKSIDSSRAGLNATLIVRHPEIPDELCVNFDPEVMQLIRETKALHRLGIDLPDSAKMILLQENKFKTNFERMRHHLDEYHRLLDRFSPVMKNLFSPHLEEFERIIRPGMVSLTWLSMNIDAYLHKIQTTLHRLNSLTTSVLGVTEYRVERNLKVISRMLLVALPSDARFTLDEYVSRQEAEVKTKTKELIRIRDEVSNALEEIVDVLRTFRTEADEPILIPPHVVNEFKSHYSHHFYLAILNAVKRSFTAIKHRLGSRQKGGFLFVDRPFFDVDVELTIPNVTMHPSLDDVQNAINESARLVLLSAKSVPILGDTSDTYHSLIAADMQVSLVPSVPIGLFSSLSLHFSFCTALCFARHPIRLSPHYSRAPQVVQSVLLLTGSVEGSKRQVLEYLETYKRYEFLWTMDKSTGYQKFIAGNPTLEEFEEELSKYQEIEIEIQNITPVHVVGCMSLRTQSLKYSLKAETSAWKSQYANNLHGRAKKELNGMMQYFDETSQKLSMDVQNVDEVGEMVAHLGQLRSREADLELQIVPVETMYYVLAKYDVRIPKDETERLANIRPMWKGLMALGHEKSSKLTQLQSAFKKELVKTVKGFALECMQFCNEFDIHGPMVAGLGPTEAQERLNKYESLCQDVEEKVKEFHDRETLFGLPKTQYAELMRVRRELDTINLLYSLYSRTDAAISKFSEFLWINVAASMAKMSQTVLEFQGELLSLPRQLREWAAYKELRQKLYDFQQVLPVLASISGPAMRTRHWNSIMQTTGKKLNLHADQLKLKHILGINPVKHRNEIEEVCTAAIKEAELEIRVRELAELWNDLVFTFASYKDRGPVTLDSRSMLDIMEKLEESLATLATITSNRYAKPLEEEVSGWMIKLSGVAEIVEHWSRVQAMWINVEAVFSLSDISTQLGSEARRFQKVDAQYMKLMAKAAEHPNIIHCCYSDNQLRNLLPHLAGQLELCQKSLSGYLDAKREAFSRFYFIPDRVLLEILSEGISTPGIEHHMRAMFEGLRFLSVADPKSAEGLIDAHKEEMQAKMQQDASTSGASMSGLGGFTSRTSSAEVLHRAASHHKVEQFDPMTHRNFGNVNLSKRNDHHNLAHLHRRASMISLKDEFKGTLVILAIHGRRGAASEAVYLDQTISVNDQTMEYLLRETLSGLTSTLIGALAESLPPIGSEPTQAISWANLVQVQTVQVCCLALQVSWTKECHDALTRARTEKNAMLQCHKHQALVLQELLGLFGGGTNITLQRLVIENLICLQMYQKEAFDDLVQKRAFVPTDFDWERHIRYYWKHDDKKMTVLIAGMECTYSWEYMGLKDRLVCTAMTQRCFVALSQAIGMCNGCSLVGPNGSGKAETIRDLGRGLGKFVPTIHCSSQTDSKSMEKVFKGLASSGAWGCFDLLSSAPARVLSACAQHISCVLAAIRESRVKFVYSDGATISLNPGCAIFATWDMNSADPRSGMDQVPSLKAMFRTINWIQPDTQAIIYSRLLSLGFDSALTLSKKLKALYELCKEQLTAQQHYDFGLRNAISVLSALVVTKKEEPGLNEQGVVCSALRRINMPRLLARDIGTFNLLLSELFPDAPNTSTGMRLIMEDIVEKQVFEDSLFAAPAWIEKVHQLNNVAHQAWCVMLTGPSGSGKNTMVRTLCRSLSSTGSKHAIHRMNPKAISTEQLFGWVDKGSGEWHDGVFSSLWRSKASKHVPGQNSWIVIDGPMDNLWIENLNSAMDNSKSLTLANGDRIPMSPGIRIVFVNDSLQHVPPAVVSRSGVVALDSKTLHWKALTATWLETRGDEQRVLLTALFDRYLGPALAFVFNNCTSALDIPLNMVPRIVTTLFESVSLQIRPENLSGTLVEKLFIFCISWGVGGRLDINDRIKLTSFFRNACDLVPTLMEGETIFDYFLDDKTADWQPWSSAVAKWEYPPTFGDVPFHDLILPTPDSTRTEFLIDMLAFQGACVLVTGATGSGKSTCIRQHEKSLNTEDHVSAHLAMCGTTLPGRLIQSFDSVTEKRQGRTYAPPGGKKCLFVIEDVSKPTADAFGDNMCFEFLRQLLVDGGYYSQLNPDFNTLLNMQYICEMAEPSVARKDLPMRLKGRMMSFKTTMPPDQVIHSIFHRMIKGRLLRYSAPKPVVSLASSICDLTIEVWHRLSAKFPPIPSRLHYDFNMHDLSRVVQGILRVPVQSIQTLESFVNLWKWEAQRSLMDKLVTNDEVINSWDYTTYVMREKIKAHIPHECYELSNNIQHKSTRRPTSANGVSPDEESQVTLFFGDINVGAPAPTSSLGGNSMGIGGAGDASKGYRQIPSQDVFGMIDDMRIKCGLDHIVLFDEAIHHVMRIARVLSCPRGSLILVGDGGAGRRPLSRMATALVGHKHMEWHEMDAQSRLEMLDLIKDAYRLAGVRGERVTLVVDNERMNTATLDLINQFLTTGEFPGLLTKDDLDMVLEEMRSAASLAESGGSASGGGGGKGGQQDTYARFIYRARACFHVILTFSPGQKFVDCLKDFPGIIRNCTLNWFVPWGFSTAMNVSNTILAGSEEFTTVEPRKLSECMASVYEIVHSFIPKHQIKTKKTVHLTPGTFLSFVKTYQQVYSRRVGETREDIRKMSAALRKLEGARVGTAAMQEDLHKKDFVLAQAQTSASELLKEITDSTMKAEKKKGEVTIVKNQLADQAALIEQDRDECERDLEAAKPSLIAAETALQSINQKDLLALKSMKNPPPIVRTILDSMLILLHRQIRPVEVVEGGAYRDSFEFAAQVMNEDDFVGRLMNFPKEALTDEDVELVAPYLAHKDFQPDKVRVQSAMAAGLCQWVRAICQYQEIARQVLPKQEKLAKAEAQLGIANRHLQKAVDELAKCQEDLDVMQSKFEIAMGEKQRLSDDSKNTMGKIDAAQKLILALQGESDRWTKQVRECEAELVRCPGDCVIAAAFMDFLGAFSLEFRAKLLSEIGMACTEIRVPVSAGYSAHRFFATKVQMREWIAAGLPPDEGSLQNGTLVVYSTRWPIVIDPQGLALNWLTALDKDIVHARIGDMVEGIRSGEKTVLEDCMVAGNHIVLSDVGESLDPCLDNLISRTYTNTGKRLSINLGGRDVEFTPSFKLVLCCPLTDNRFDSFMSSLANVIDFSMTLKGLESQLLALVIEIDKVELKRRKERVALALSSHSKELEELNKSLLKRLSGAEGNLLDDEALMSVLWSTKNSAEKSRESLQDALAEDQGVNQACEEYSPVALRAALLFFAANDMSSLSSFYHLSLPSFIKLFTDSVTDAETVIGRQSRVPAIVASATKVCFHLPIPLFRLLSCSYTLNSFDCFPVLVQAKSRYPVLIQPLRKKQQVMMEFSKRVYFSQHHEVFQLLVALKVAEHELKTITTEHIYALSKAGKHLNISSAPRKPKEWLSDACYLNLLGLSERIPKFHGIVELFAKREVWRQWMDKDRPEEESLPDESYEGMNKLLLVRATREDRFPFAVRAFVKSIMGTPMTEGHTDLSQTLNMSTSSTPIICASQSGHDPSPFIIALSRRR